MPRILLAMVLLPLLATAAPVPKRKPAFGPFGDFTDSKTKCTAELAKDGTLSITVPPGSQLYEPWRDAPPLPTITRTLSDDFVLTVRVVHPTAQGLAPFSEQVKRLVVGAGLVIRAEGKPEAEATMFVLHTMKKEGWDNGMRLSSHGWKDGGQVRWSHVGVTRGGRPDEYTYLRFTRRGNEVLSESSEDGVKWREHHRCAVAGLDGEISVGPVAFHTTDQTSTATFDQFSLELLTDAKK